MTQIEFFFDFISPYAHLAAPRVQALAQRHGRPLAWRPFRLGVTVVKVMGLRPMMETPLKSDYVRADLKRLSVLLDEPLHLGSTSVSDVSAAPRLFYAVEPADRERVALALLHARWAEGIDIGDAAALRRIAVALGLDPALANRCSGSDEAKAQLRQTTEDAIARGVFGSPTCAVGEHLFWGVDRLWMLDEFLAAGERYRALPPPLASALAYR